ncbi:hypothetical protein IV203_038652 [Nitzschia inconspicua]|uniref:Uncharacterized protein n=1 Tax=Nitzschia inconspicua TaxID=303405 RepID=A0A9K3LP91_9STRA|nr:hypothetical protein IV203_038652 [Nitzschia inconspicua]
MTNMKESSAESVPLEMDDFNEMEILEATEHSRSSSSTSASRWLRWLVPTAAAIVAAILLSTWGASLAKSKQSLNNDGAGPGNTANDASMSSASSWDCTAAFECLTDRIGHFDWIKQGQALCNDEHRFGLTKSGILIMESCGNSETGTNRTTVTLMSHLDAKGFRMTDHGNFQLVASVDVAADVTNDDNILEDAIPIVPIEPTGRCLNRPVMECPYLHLHKSGDLVLNSVNSDGSWSDRKASKVFPDLFA